MLRAHCRNIAKTIDTSLSNPKKLILLNEYNWLSYFNKHADLLFWDSTLAVMNLVLTRVKFSSNHQWNLVFHWKHQNTTWVACPNQKSILKSFDNFKCMLCQLGERERMIQNKIIKNKKRGKKECSAKVFWEKSCPNGRGPASGPVPEPHLAISPFCGWTTCARISKF